jgi:hypothetical protein
LGVLGSTTAFRCEGLQNRGGPARPWRTVDPLVGRPSSSSGGRGPGDPLWCSGCSKVGLSIGETQE